MSNAYVSSLAIYPLKSSAAISCETVKVLGTGLQGDRRFMLTKLDGSFITGRTHPKISSISSYYRGDDLVLQHPSCEELLLQPQHFSSSYFPTSVWGTSFMGQGCGLSADQWISELLGEPLRILYFGEQSKRKVNKHEVHEVGFADGFPLLLVNDNSLQHLNQRLPAPISMANFRPNITIAGLPAWQEDEWAKIRIGEVLFELPKPCSRCVFTTVDPHTQQPDKNLEPLKTLTSYRQEQDGTNVMFGENMLALNSGTIKIGDKVEVIKTKARPVYQDNWQPAQARLAKQLTISADTNSSQTLPGTDVASTIHNKELLRCVQVIDETADVKTFKFIADPIVRFGYLPGQFITLHAEIDKQLENRCYTLSSSPSRPDLISITVKRVEGGLFSNWLHDSFAVGSSIECTKASGVFYLQSSSRAKLLLLSAGSGITPMLSIARYITDLSLNIDVQFHHSARTDEDLICFEELQLLAAQHANLYLSCNFTRQSDVANCDIDHFFGRLSTDMLNQFSSDLLEREVFVCGPDEFMTAAKMLLTQLDLPGSQYHQESFVIDVAPPEHDASNRTYKVNFLQSGIEVQISGDQTILAAAEEAGITVDYSCLAGICGTCNSKLVNGELHAPNAMAIDTEDGSGDFLPCCSYARSDL
ncbi:MAG: MOSC domain-containing protein, partial [Oceanospirillaceae bacterium]|nr:MOSC domain-containing protein [Oceanospirillaceae bacterium]